MSVCVFSPLVVVVASFPATRAMRVLLSSAAAAGTTHQSLTTVRSIAFLSAPDVDDLPEAESNKVRDALMRNLSAVATNRRNLISACEESHSLHDAM